MGEIYSHTSTNIFKQISIKAGPPVYRLVDAEDEPRADQHQEDHPPPAPLFHPRLDDPSAAGVRRHAKRPQINLLCHAMNDPYGKHRRFYKVIYANQ